MLIYLIIYFIVKLLEMFMDRKNIMLRPMHYFFVYIKSSEDPWKI